LIRVFEKHHVRDHSVDALKSALNGHVVATCLSFTNDIYQYRNGVYNGNCEREHAPNHCVNIVGYGLQGDIGEYWIVRNSWGDVWGEHGYIRIAIEEGSGVCGIQKFNSYPSTN
jgi:C1A family cysteine protease